MLRFELRARFEQKFDGVGRGLSTRTANQGRENGEINFGAGLTHRGARERDLRSDLAGQERPERDSNSCR